MGQPELLVLLQADLVEDLLQEAASGHLGLELLAGFSKSVD